MLAHALKNALARAWRASAGLGGHVLMQAAADRDLTELRRGLAEADHVAEALFERGEDSRAARRRRSTFRPCS